MAKSNRYEDVEEGQVRTLDEVQEIFEHPRATAWDLVWLPLLRSVSPTELARETGIRKSELIPYRKGAVTPRPRQMKRLIAALRLEAAPGGGHGRWNSVIIGRSHAVRLG